MIRVSNSSKDLYNRSPRAYYLRYLLNLKEEKEGSALIMGRVVDAGLNELILTKDRQKALDAAKIQLAKENFSNVRFNRAELEDTTPETYGENLLLKVEAYIEQYEVQILPKIKKVLAVQEPFEVLDDKGDCINGFIDLICEWEDGRILVIDNKTSSMKYKDDKIETEGQQLAIYQIAASMKYTVDAVGYIVIMKTIRKSKQPKVVIQELIREMPSELIELTMKEYGVMIHNIRLGNFPCTTPKCDSYFGECPYKKYCLSGGRDLTGLKYSKREVK